LVKRNPKTIRPDSVRIQEMNIIGLSGTNGSGKDTVMNLLSEKYGFFSASATEMLVSELNNRGWALDRKHKAMLSSEWRRQHGMGVVVDKAIELFEQQPKGKYKGLVVGSLRHPGEADSIHKFGGQLIWVDADPKVRYSRIQANLQERIGTHAEHGLSFKEFQAEESREMNRQTDDKTTLDMSAVKEKSDIFLQNDSNSAEAFKTEVQKILNL